MVASLNAVVGEWAVMDSLKAVVQPTKFDYAEVIRLVKRDYVLRERYKSAVREDICFTGKSVDELIDYVYGLDIVFDYRGWRIGLDVTLNWKLAEQKLEKLNKLRQQHAGLEIDNTIVLVLSTGKDLSADGIRKMLSMAIATHTPIVW